jgi:hypothetical protein
MPNKNDMSDLAKFFAGGAAVAAVLGLAIFFGYSLIQDQFGEYLLAAGAKIADFAQTAAAKIRR